MKFLIGFLITIGLLIFMFALIFRGGDSTDQKSREGSRLLDYANSSSVVMQMTTEGPVSADQTHRSVRITVGSTESSIEIFQGYEGTLLDSRTYQNNSAAYADFLQALQLSGYNLGDTSKELADWRGRCQAGSRYIMGIKDGARDIQQYWSTSCGGTSTFKGKTPVIRELFIRQIPDYQAVAGGISF